MQRVFDRYFICEDGHITASNEKINKCPAKEWQIEYVKGKRKKWEGVKKEAGTCGKKIVEEREIPPVLRYDTVWDYETMHAFLIGQKLDAAFMLGIQEQFVKIWEKLNGKV